jgi:putative transposase
MINPKWKERLHRYITGIIQGNKYKVMQINSMPDDIHIFIGMRPDQSVSSLIQNVETESSKWINAQKFCGSSFAWQEGYGAFSYGKSRANRVVKYIRNQEENHRKENFLSEYKRLLNLFEIDWDPNYVFKKAE